MELTLKQIKTMDVAIAPTIKRLFCTQFTADYDFMKPYWEDDHLGVAIDNLFIYKYGHRIFDPEAEGREARDLWHQMVDGIIMDKAVNLTRIWDALHSEFNPLDNYDKYSEVTTKIEGTASNKTGTVSSNMDYLGTEKNKNIKSGTESNTATVGASHIRAENYAAPWDSPSKENEVYTGETTQDQDEQTNSGSTTYENVTDTATREFDGRKDQKEDTYNLTDTVDTTQKVEEHTHGNIGVTTSMQLLKSLVDDTSTMDFYKNLFMEIMLELTY